MNEQADFIPVSMPHVGAAESALVTRCVESGWVSSIGEFVERFEEGFAARVGQRHGASVNSGTAALHLALHAMGVGPGDEVIVPGLTFAATANAVLYRGARPVIADVDPTSWNLDPGVLDELTTAATRVVIPVHLYGRPCDMGRIGEWAARRGVRVVEDAAEAHGASIGDAPAGSFGDVACFSFYANKLITTGEGGMCVTSDPDLNRHIRLLRDHGMSKERRYWHDEVGYNYRMTNMQAAMGCAQLERLDDFVQRRRWIRDRYAERLQGLGCELPGEDPGTRSVFWLFTFLLPPGTTATQRDALMDHLRTAGVDSRPVFYPLAAMPAYREYARPTPVADDLAARGISLPTFFTMDEAMIERVTAAVRSWFGAAAR